MAKDVESDATLGQRLHQGILHLLNIPTYRQFLTNRAIPELSKNYRDVKCPQIFGKIIS
jgi:hypothetical protein